MLLFGVFARKFQWKREGVLFCEIEILVLRARKRRRILETQRLNGAIRQEFEFVRVRESGCGQLPKMLRSARKCGVEAIDSN